MINNLFIKNFKSLKEVNIPLKKLNILTGLNSMGKSSVIQTLLLIYQSSSDDSYILLNNPEYVELGTGKDVLYENAEEKKITISPHFSSVPTYHIGFVIDYNAESERLKKTIFSNIEELSVPEIHSFLRKTTLQYLKAERNGPLKTYPTSTYFINQKLLGTKGEYTVHYLNIHGSDKVTNDALLHPKAKSNTLIHQTEAWLSEISPGTKLNTTKIPGTDLVLLDYQFETNSDYTNRYRPVNVGFGLSYTLPVIVALLTAKEDSLIIVENPEAHLHPRGQAEIAKLAARAAKTNAQIIFETHSDHIINGLRVAIKENEIPKNEVGLFFFERKSQGHESFTTISEIQIDKNGELSNYPQNFLDEWNNQLFKLI
jgi:predicted ATPase